VPYLSDLQVCQDEALYKSTFTLPYMIMFYILFDIENTTLVTALCCGMLQVIEHLASDKPSTFSSTASPMARMSPVQAHVSLLVLLTFLGSRSFCCWIRSTDSSISFPILAGTSNFFRKLAMAVSGKRLVMPAVSSKQEEDYYRINLLRASSHSVLILCRAIKTRYCCCFFVLSLCC